MIYTVTFNPSLDYIVTVEHFASGIVNRTKNEIIYPGGKGINVSMVLKNLGHENTALGFLAGFTGDEIEQLLEEKGITTNFIKVEKGFSRINVKLRSDEETEINGQGPVIAASDIDALYRRLDTLSDGDILVLAGSIPDVMPSSMYMDIMTHLKEKKLKIVVDATKDLLVNVLVSMAGDGAVLIAEDGNVFMAEAPEGELKNSVGAGDSMVAGFLAGYLESGSYADAFRMGVCSGSASAFSEELATRAEVLALLDKNKGLFEKQQREKEEKV